VNNSVGSVKHGTKKFPFIMFSYSRYILPVSGVACTAALMSHRLPQRKHVFCDDGLIQNGFQVKRHESRLIRRRSSRLIREDSPVDRFGGSSDNRNGEASEESEFYYIDPEKQQNTMIFAPPHNSELVAEVCANLGVSLSRSFSGRFADGECSIKVQDEVRGADCFIIQGIERDSNSGSKGSHLINDAIMEMILMTAALRRASARSITVVLPYVPYARHMETLPDEVDTQSTPVAASDIARMIESIGADRVICVDVHRGSWEGCFNPSVSVNNIDPQVLAVKYFEQRRLIDPVIVSPDVVASDRAKAFYKRMRLHGYNCSLATMVSNRKYQEQAVRGGVAAEPAHATDGKLRILNDGQIVLPSGKTVSLANLMTREWLVGDVSGRDCIIVDDMIDSGKRLARTSQTLKKCGARKVFMFATHGVMSGLAIKRIEESPVAEVVVTNTLSQRRDVACDRLRVLSVAGLLSETIRRVQMGESVSSLYDRSIIDTALEPRHGDEDGTPLQ
jgi:ribose-phosphate pyrophosphokinase